MKNKLCTEMQKIIDSYQEILNNWSNFEAFEGPLNQCQAEINSLVFTPDDYLDEEVYGLLIELKGMHHSIFEKSSQVWSDTKNKYDTVVASKNKILKYTQE